MLEMRDGAINGCQLFFKSQIPSTFESEGCGEDSRLPSERR